MATDSPDDLNLLICYMHIAYSSPDRQKSVPNVYPILSDKVPPWALTVSPGFRGYAPTGSTASRMRLHVAFAASGPLAPFTTSPTRPRLRLPGTTRLVLRISLASSECVILTAQLENGVRPRFTREKSVDILREGRACLPMDPWRNSLRPLRPVRFPCGWALRRDRCVPRCCR